MLNSNFEPPTIYNMRLQQCRLDEQQYKSKCHKTPTKTWRSLKPKKRDIWQQKMLEIELVYFKLISDRLSKDMSAKMHCVLVIIESRMGYKYI